MDLRQLAYLVAVVDEGTFTAAARASFVAQPSLSQSVRALERELGIEVFARVGRGVALTAAGETVVEAARDALRAVDRLRDAASDTQALLRGRLDLVALPTLAVDPATHLIGRFRGAHPGVTVRLTQPDDAHALLDAVRQGRSEIGITEVGDDHPGLVTVPLAEQQLAAVCPPGTDLPARERITARELAALPLVVPPRGTSTRRLLDDALGAAGATATLAVETDQREAITALVLAGAGATVLPTFAAEAARAAGAVVRRLEPPLVRRIGLVHRPAPLSRAGAAFVDLARSM